MLIFGFEPFNEKEFKHFILNRSQFTKGQLNSIRYVYTKGLSKKNIYEQ